MKLEEVLPALRAGKKIHRPLDRGLIPLDGKTFIGELILADDWEILEEQPQLIDLSRKQVFKAVVDTLYELSTLKNEDIAGTVCGVLGFKE